MPKPLVIQTEELEPGPAAWLAERCELVACPYKDAARLDVLLPRAAGLIVRTYTRVNAAMLDKAPGLRVVARAGVALENIDVPECRRRGITVVHAPGANTRAVVEYVWAQILDAYRPMHYLTEALPPDEWHATRNRFTAPRQLTDLTLGIWGFGRIGSAMARVAHAMEVRALYNDLLEIPAASRHGAEPVSVERMLRESDILTVHVDYRPANEKLVGAAVLARMKPDAVLINASRGFVADPAAIASWCRSHPKARAFLDVHDPTEPIGPEYPALGIPNLHVAPHLASGTVTAKTNMSWVVRDVWRVLSGDKPEFEAPAL
ncbi:MAG: 3-phosphoglycerate dehydrogenase [Phycisphaerales bacterium]|nr:3-phosphoglycerate dehydrogenase [Phycisphaerales bacterium]